MISHWVGTCEQKVPVEVLAIFVGVVGHEVTVLRVAHNDSEALPPLLKLFQTRLFVVIVARGNLGMFFDHSLDKGKLTSLRFGKDHIVGLIFIESAQGTLIKKVWVDYLALNGATHNFRVKFCRRHLFF